jgi:hypothetical protein
MCTLDPNKINKDKKRSYPLNEYGGLYTPNLTISNFI